MAGGYGNIDPKDNPKPFKEGNTAAEKWTEDKATELGESLIEWLKAKDKKGKDKGNIFFKEFLVVERDLYLDIIDHLKGKFTTFSILMKRAKEIQEVKLVKYGLHRRLDSSMTKFTLTNNHDWKEKSDNVNENKGKTTIEVIDYSKGD